MGTLVSDTDRSGMVVRDVILGQPARDLNGNGQPTGPYRWDDSRLPSGVIATDGTIIIDEPEGI